MSVPTPWPPASEQAELSILPAHLVPLARRCILPGCLQDWTRHPLLLQFPFPGMQWHHTDGSLCPNEMTLVEIALARAAHEQDPQANPRVHNHVDHIMPYHMDEVLDTAVDGAYHHELAACRWMRPACHALAHAGKPGHGPDTIGDWQGPPSLVHGKEAAGSEKKTGGGSGGKKKRH